MLFSKDEKNYFLFLRQRNVKEYQINAFLHKFDNFWTKTKVDLDK
jgi:hypothetical protein